MLLSLSHPYPSFSPGTPDRPPLPTPLFSPSHFRTTLLSTQNPKPSKSHLRTSVSRPTATTETLPTSAIQRIAEKLRSLGYLDDQELPNRGSGRPETGPGSAGEIFIPTPGELPKYRVGHTIDSSWSTPERPVPEPGSGTAIARFHELRRELQIEGNRRAAPAPTLAELTIPAEELKRLRSLGIGLDKSKRLKVGRAGITEGIVNGIHERWRRSEIVKIKCEDLCRMNMKRTHDILERKTGGFVIWRSGSIIILYRGANYKYPYFSDSSLKDGNVLDKISLESTKYNRTYNEQEGNSLSAVGVNSSAEPSSSPARSSLVVGVVSPSKVRFQLPGEAQLVEEADQLLDGLGPRFTDWWGCDPLPVDADLLPAIVPGHRRPFRLLPYGVKPKLTDQEMTILKRLGRPLPCHFALGRNRNHQGLAVSMIKLWEKCEIAKIAVKRGLQNTNSELMAEELKRLTGGTLLSRDKEFIVFYRGKDFLPPAVSNALEERRNYLMYKQKPGADESSFIATKPGIELGLAVPASVDEPQDANKQKICLSAERRLNPAISADNTVDAKLSRALEKKAKAEKLLEELEKSTEPPKPEIDKEAISKEERYMLRKVGLRMKPFLLLGRRGVFDGTVENMHLHWKYRELVKIISKNRCIEDVYRAGRTLEVASGGILVAVERVSKGHAIIVYRGKNYRRPAALRPQTLLNKKEAMRCFLEAQRHESLKLHVLKLSRNIKLMKHQLAKDDSRVDLSQSTKCERVNIIFEAGNHSGSEECAYDQRDVEAEGGHEGNAKSLHSIEFNGTSNDPVETDNASINVMESQFPSEYIEDKLIDSEHGDEFSETALVQSFSEPGPDNTTHEEIGYRSADLASKTKFILKQDQASCSVTENVSDVPSKSSFEASQSKPDSYFQKDEIEKESDVGICFKAAPISNKERLVLRKQALNMKKRPVLAIGRNNVIAGVAKAIKTHFQKYPLAIVNVKGRAKGTSVQEVVFELEQATGAVLVSREPNKVILYRGWLEVEKPGVMKKEKKGDVRKTPGGVDMVSPQLLSAIRLECGLQTNPEEETSNE